MSNNTDSYFSIAFELVLKGDPLPYDLYINSAAKLNRERFVRIFPLGDVLTHADIEEFKVKYHQLYVREDQRAAYLKSLVKRDLSGRRDKHADIVKAKAIKDSAIHYLDKLFDKDQKFTTEVLDEAITGCRESVESMVELVQDYDITSLQEMIGELSFHDFYTYDHSINVSMYNIALFKAVKPGASAPEIITVGLGGLLHDLGKIKIPTSIINNPDKLSDDQFEIIKQHPEFGKELIGECDCNGHEDVDFGVIERVVYEHHENYNGSGYPNKVGGEDIHLYARITAISDFFDALTTKRSYHEVMSTEEALGIMSKSIGKKIDPNLFSLFVNQVNGVDGTIEGAQELPIDFDPCQPHAELPLMAVEAPRKAIKKVVKKKIVKKVKKKAA